MTYFRVFSQPVQNNSRTAMQKTHLSHRILMYSLIGSKLIKVNISCVLADDLLFLPLLSLKHDRICLLSYETNLFTFH